MAFLRRILIIFFAFLLAALIAAAIMIVGAMAHRMFIFGLSALPRDPNTVLVTVLGIPLMSVAVAIVAFLPTMMVVGFAEFYRLRSLTYYAIAGGIVGIICRATLSFGILSIRPPSQQVSTWNFSANYMIAVTIAAVAGIAAGYVYWIVAGRNAGQWRDTLAQ